MKPFFRTSLFLILSASLLLLVGCADDRAKQLANEFSSSSLVVSESFLDRGTIAMDQGTLAMDYDVTNTGTDPVVIKEMYTSCMCTSARLQAGGEWAPIVGMKGHGYDYSLFRIIEPGETAQVQVYFDPNAHGPMGVGTNRRSVYLETNSSMTPQIKLDFTVDVVRTSAELSSSQEENVD